MKEPGISRTPPQEAITETLRYFSHYPEEAVPSLLRLLTDPSASSREIAREVSEAIRPLGHEFPRSIDKYRAEREYYVQHAPSAFGLIEELTGRPEAACRKLGYGIFAPLVPERAFLEEAGVTRRAIVVMQRWYAETNLEIREAIANPDYIQRILWLDRDCQPMSSPKPKSYYRKAA
jgi:hypothetical protein